MNNWDNINKENYFNLSLEDRVRFYTDTLVINPIDEFHNSKFIKNYYNDIVKIIFNGIVNNKSTQQIASNLGHLTKMWTVDWHWIAHHITLDNSNILIANDIQRKIGRDAIVYKYIQSNDCNQCKKLYLKEVSGNEPKTFKLFKLFKNGHNLNFNREALTPVIGTSLFGYDKINESFHWDFSSLVYLPRNYFWDKGKNIFVVKPISKVKTIKKLGGYFKTDRTVKENKIIYKTQFIRTKTVGKDVPFWQKINSIFKKCT